jgi:hypothetical protein
MCPRWGVPKTVFLTFFKKFEEIRFFKNIHLPQGTVVRSPKTEKLKIQKIEKTYCFVIMGSL